MLKVASGDELGRPRHWPGVMYVLVAWIVNFAWRLQLAKMPRLPMGSKVWHWDSTQESWVDCALIRRSPCPTLHRLHYCFCDPCTENENQKKILSSEVYLIFQKYIPVVHSVLEVFRPLLNLQLHHATLENSSFGNQYNRVEILRWLPSGWRRIDLPPGRRKKDNCIKFIRFEVCITTLSSLVAWAEFICREELSE